MIWLIGIYSNEQSLDWCSHYKNSQRFQSRSMWGRRRSKLIVSLGIMYFIFLFLYFNSKSLSESTFYDVRLWHHKMIDDQNINNVSQGYCHLNKLTFYRKMINTTKQSAPRSQWQLRSWEFIKTDHMDTLETGNQTGSHIKRLILFMWLAW